MENTDWCSKSVFCDDAEIETYFHTESSFYFGDPNSKNIQDFDDPRLHISLPDLSFNLEKSQWSNANLIIGNENELGAYYRYLIEQAYMYKRSFNTIRHHFWMRSSLVSKSNNIAVGFPWYDSSSEFSAIFRWIVAGEEGETFFDADQGWQLNGVIKADRVYFLESDDSFPVDLQSSEIYANVAFSLERLQSQAQENISKIKNLIAELTEEIGVDVWSKHHYEEHLNFGTNSWRPKNDPLG